MYDAPNFFDQFDTLNKKIDQFLFLEQPMYFAFENHTPYVTVQVTLS